PIEQIIDRRGSVWEYEQDAYGNLHFMKDPEGMSVTAHHDLMNRDTLTVRTAPVDNLPDRTVTIRKEFDPEGNLLHLEVEDTLDYRWQYDEGQRTIQHTVLDRAGNVIDGPHPRPFYEPRVGEQ